MARLDHLDVTFHAKLGTQGSRVERIARLAEEIAPLVGADPVLARRAAVLAKADLTTEIVGEFPELQGAMGRKYALLQGEDASVAAALAEHYRPQGPSDVVPTDPVSMAVALADKLDTLVGFWAIDEKPTGSKDPYALRRAALGVVRILVENGVRLELFSTWHQSWLEMARQAFRLSTDPEWTKLDEATVHLPVSERREILSKYLDGKRKVIAGTSDRLGFDLTSREADLIAFFHDRLKVYLRDKGARHDLIDAVLAGGAAPSSGPSGHLLPAGEKKAPGDGAQQPGEGAMMQQPQQAYDVERGHVVTPTPALRADPPHKGEGGQSQNDDLLLIVRKVEALGAFLETEAGKNLLAGTKRAANILAAEEKKKTVVADRVDAALFRDPAENTLYEAVNQAESAAAQAIQNQDYSAVMQALSALREPVDSFFERVLVNDEDAGVRGNRLALLSRIRAATGQVADFSKIAG